MPQTTEEVGGSVRSPNSPTNPGQGSSLGQISNHVGVVGDRQPSRIQRLRTEVCAVKEWTMSEGE